MNRINQAFLFLFLAVTLSTFAQQKIKVACIGNSITYGYGLKPEQAYPVQLQLLLGDKYEVHNYGNSARTLLSKGNLPYTKERIYQDALDWNPDIVVIKLGTNDSKPINWKYQNEFVADYITLVKTIKNLPSHPKIYLCYPIPVFAHANNFHPEWGINDSIIANGIIPKIRKVQKKTHALLIDLRTPLLGKEQLVFDGIHPNADGAKFIAGEVYKHLANKE
jgi:lysophospholipase L1-like esterase